jgi:hypothetical protein
VGWRFRVVGVKMETRIGVARTLAKGCDERARAETREKHLTTQSEK